MTNDDLEKYLRQQSDIELVQVTGDGYHYELVIVSDLFIDKSTVERQQWVYAQLSDYIKSGSIHALTMKTSTSSEWKNRHG